MLPAMPADVVPYITVAVNEHGAVVWQVVAAGIAVNCWTGARATEVLRAVCKSKGIKTP